MKSLSQLELGIGPCPEADSPDQSLFKTVKWELPSLTSLRIDETVLTNSLRANEVKDLPRVLSPGLKEFSLTGSDEAYEGAVETCMMARQLTSMRLMLLGLETEPERQLVKALREDHWPNLTDIDITQSVDGILGALASLKPGMKRVDVHQDNRTLDDVCAVLTTHASTLESFSCAVIREAAYDSDDDSEESLELQLIDDCEQPKQAKQPKKKKGKSPVGPEQRSLPKLTRLSLDAVSDRLFRSFHFPALTQLELRGGFIHLSSLALVLECCPALVDLEMFCRKVHVGAWSPPKTAHAALRELRLSSGISILLKQPETLTKLLASLPQLKLLSLDHDAPAVHSRRGRQLLTVNDAKFVDAIAQCGEKGHLQQLRTLSISVAGVKLSLKTVKRLLKALPRLTLLEFDCFENEATRSFVKTTLANRAQQFATFSD